MTETATLEAPKTAAPIAPRAFRGTDGRLQLSEHARVHWDYTPESGTPFEALLEPSYWAHVTKKMNFNGKGLGGIIDVVAEDYTYFGRLLVVDVGRAHADVIQLEFQTLERKSKADTSPEYEIKFGGNVHKWRVMRIADKQVMQSGCQDEAAARRWLESHLKALAN